MSWRARTGAVLGAMAMALLPAGVAHAQEPEVVSVSIAWAGQGSTGQADVSVFGSPVVVPGDNASRTLRVHNAGPTTATLTARAVDMALSEPGHEDDLYDRLLVNGVPVSRLAAEETVLHRTSVPRGGSVDLPFTYELPLTTAGNSADGEPRGVSFVVHLEMTGSLGGDGGGVAEGGVPGAQPPGADGGTDGVWSETGGAVVVRAMWPFVAAGVAAAVAVVSAQALRRRRQRS